MSSVLVGLDSDTLLRRLPAKESMCHHHLTLPNRLWVSNSSPETEVAEFG